MNTKNLIDILKESVPADRKSNIKFPSGIVISGSDNPLRVNFYLNASVVQKNMQEDSAAFEGWLLALKSSRGAAIVSISWEQPKDITSKHYQRFLYRLSKFKNLFDDWVEIDSEILSKHLIIKNDKTYYLNLPNIIRDETVTHIISEGDIEKLFVKSQDALKSCSGCERINRQLPVGLFKKEKYDASNDIFPRNKAQIDLWGIDKYRNLHIFELKKPSYRPLGIISELFFYAMVSEDLMKGRFCFGNKSKLAHPFNPKTIEGIRAYILVNDWHPLVTPKMLQILNNALKKHKRNVRFGLMHYELSTKCDVIYSGVN
jgi:hypothetical protein